MTNTENFFTTPAQAGPGLDVEFTVATRIGIDGKDGFDGQDGRDGRDGQDGVSVMDAVITPGGNLEISLSDGRTVNAGLAIGKGGLAGIATPSTLPAASSLPQLYIATGAGTYTNFKNESGAPLVINASNAIGFFFRAADDKPWNFSLINIDLTGYTPREAVIHLSSEAPDFACYPYSEEAEDFYNPATGVFTLPEGIKTIASKTEVFGKIVYQDCTHILLGFSLETVTYLEVATGRRMIINVATKAITYGTPISQTGIAGKYVRVDTRHFDAMEVEIEQSDNGIDYTHYATVDREVRYGWTTNSLRYRSIGFYQEEGTKSKILSIGTGTRLMLDNIAEDTSDSDSIEVLIPSANFAGIAKRRIHLPKNSVAKTSQPRIVLFGDSITQEFGVPAGTYTDLIKSRFNASQVTALGYAGHKYGHDDSISSDTLCDNAKFAAIAAESPDLVLILAGSNDYWHGNMLGDEEGDFRSDAYRKTTSGGMRYTLSCLQASLGAGCRIIVCTPPPGYMNGQSDMGLNAQGLKMKAYVERIKTIAGEFHIPVCDFWGQAGWSPEREATAPKYTTDGIHLSAEGYERLTALQYRTAMGLL